MRQSLLFVILVIAGFVFREIGKTGRTTWAKFLPWPCWFASVIVIAKGQREQTGVLGEGRVCQLAVLDKVLQAAVANPNIVKIPNVLVQGQSGGFEGPAAILGASNLMQSIGEGGRDKQMQK